MTAGAALSLIAACAAGCRCDEPAGQAGGQPAAAEMVLVTGGRFLMGALDNDGRARPCERPRHPVVLSSFYLDLHEVTVAAYARAVKAGVVKPPNCRAENAAQRSLCTWRQPGMADHPINGVSWFQADAYCRWLGRRLPTEAEFEYALRGGQDGALYPWGDSDLPPPGVGNIVGQETARRFPDWPRIEGYRDRFTGPSPVGSFPRSRLGLYDMLGNQWEWCADWFGEAAFTDEEQRDPRGPAAGQHRVMRGGGFHCQLEELRSSERHHKRPADDSIYTGFRCARDAPGR